MIDQKVVPVSDRHFAFLVLHAATNNITLEEQLSLMVSHSITVYESLTGRKFEPTPGVDYQAVVNTYALGPEEKPAKIPADPTCIEETGCAGCPNTEFDINTCEECSPPTDADALVPCSGSEIPGVCITCDAVDDCKTRDPKAGCITATMQPQKEPKCPDINPVCKNCQSFDSCESHDPAVEKCVGEAIVPCACCDLEEFCGRHVYSPTCKGAVAAIKKAIIERDASPKVRKCCPTCGHHKTKKSFEDSCPRSPELMFKGGKLSATQLMLETSLKDCEHWILKPEKEKKARASKKPVEPVEQKQAAVQDPMDSKPTPPTCPKGQKEKGCITCKFYNWCPNSGDSEERRLFQSFGAGCCGFSEAKMLCRNPEGIMCTLEKRQEYRCPIRHADEPAADPSWEEMQERVKKGLNPRTGLNQKIKDNEVSPRYFCSSPECLVEHCEAQYSYAGCKVEEAKKISSISYCTPCKTWSSCEQHKPHSDGCKAHRMTAEDLLKFSEECPSDGKNGKVCGGCPAEEPCSKREAERQLIDVLWDSEQQAAEDKPAEKGTREWLEELTASKRKNNPTWLFEIWASNPKEPVDWLFSGARTMEYALDLLKQYETSPGKKTGTILRIQPRPDSEQPALEKKTPRIGIDFQPCESLCFNCGNHPENYKNSCPRYNDLTGNGGIYSHTDLVEEIQRDGCAHKIPKCQPAPKPARIRKAKKRFSIKIEPVTINAPTLVRAGRKYIVNTEGPSCGSGGSETTKNEVIRSILQPLHIWQKDPHVCKHPITEKEVSFNDLTGEFTIRDFFDPDGKMKAVPMAVANGDTIKESFEQDGKGQKVPEPAAGVTS